MIFNSKLLHKEYFLQASWKMLMVAALLYWLIYFGITLKYLQNKLCLEKTGETIGKKINL